MMWPDSMTWWIKVQVQFSSVQSFSHVWFFVTPWTAPHQASLSITNSRSSLKLMSIGSVMPSSHLILCCPLLLLPPIPPSISLIQWVNSSYEVAKVLEFQLQHHSFQRKISFRMGWLDLLAVQGTLKSLLLNHSSKASILWCSAFFTVQLSRPYMTTGKTIALTSRTFVGKVMSLLFNMLSRLVITFLPRTKLHLYKYLNYDVFSLLEI